MFRWGTVAIMTGCSS